MDSVGPDCPICQPSPRSGRSIALNDDGDDAERDLHSTCSPEATARGPGQRVLSYSIYLRNALVKDRARFQAYVDGIRNNVE